MATDGFNYGDTFLAGEDLSAKLYYAVESAGTSKQVSVVDAQGAPCIGILYEEGTSGQAVSVKLGGVVKAQIGGTVSFGDDLTTTAAGKLESAGSGDAVVATALEDAVDGDIAKVHLNSQYIIP